jgi:hypothetical protein
MIHILCLKMQTLVHKFLISSNDSSPFKLVKSIWDIARNNKIILSSSLIAFALRIIF